MRRKPALQPPAALAVHFALDSVATPPQDFPTPLVSSRWDTTHVEGPNLVVLQIGEREICDAAHVPAATSVTRNEFAAGDETPFTLGLPSTDAPVQQLWTHVKQGAERRTT